jgi:DUF1365 family protein
VTLVSALYLGEVVHQRMRPKRHRLRYRVFTLCLDLDELPAIGNRLWLFGYNRRALFSFHERDHGAGQGSLRAWVEERLVEAGLGGHPKSVRVLCYPRILGYVFNPLTVYYCCDADGEPLAMLYEVSNTWGERHTYVVPATTGEGRVLHQIADKAFFVSPFIEMNCTYHFRVALPGERAAVAIAQHDRDGLLLTAAFAGHRRPLADLSLALAFFRYPLMTLKVIAAIHLEALRLWMKGVPVVPYKPATKRVSTSLVTKNDCRVQE